MATAQGLRLEVQVLIPLVWALAMAGLEHGALPPSSPVASPDSKRARTQGDKEEDLDLELVPEPPDFTKSDDRAALVQSGAPEWALAFMNSLDNKMDRCYGLMMGFHERLNRMEQNPIPKEVEERFRKLEGMIQQAQQQAGASSAQPAITSYKSVPPPAQAPVNYSQQGPIGYGIGSTVPSSMLTNYNHLIAGGWDDGTKRDIILQNAKMIFDKLQPSVQPTEWVVFGRRNSTCHIHLPELPHNEGLQRFQLIKQQIHDKYQAAPSTSRYMWITASKPKEVRLRNRGTMRAQEKLQNLLQSLGSTLELEVQWGRALIWLDCRRAASAEPSQLLADASSRIVALSTDDSQPGMLYHFNLSAISALTGEPEERVERALFGGQ